MESKFGEGQGAHGGVWECPDLLELPVEGTELKKWVLVCNLNPGGPFGGSATQYFVGTFDGKKFVNESPAVTKWMDWEKTIMQLSLGAMLLQDVPLHWHG